ncbi:DNRLRE domain-containing protein, partial [bacterium]|nr:DNRLRE domain-containing protein [bacterium]
PEGTQLNPGSTTNLGSASAGTTLSRGFRIENTGTAAMVIQNPSALLSGSTTCFQQESSPSATIAAGSSSTFSVRFGCATEGSYSTSLRVESNDPLIPQFVVSLAGTVTAMVNQPPAVCVDAPAAGQVVSGTALAFEGWATDGGGVQTLQIRLDGQALQPGPSILAVSRGDVCSAIPVGDPNCPMVGFRALVDTTQIPDGVHSLGIVATDALGATGSASVAIDVRNVIVGITRTFVAAEDTFIEQANPTAIRGTSSRIVVHGGEPSLGRLKYGILKFNVTNVSGTVTSARLKLREDYGRSVAQLAIWRITGGPWYESSFNWSQFTTGIVGFSLYSTVFNLPASTMSSIDVTGLVSGSGVVSIGLSTPVDIDYYFASSESFTSSKRPVLEVTYAP